ncbi:MAG: hypothetical protein BBJ57_11320 [Desulfobacterales bacterium PC51MH44]|nr:MAG: hypothetical protein BBJ57_11320 [Desulfobacterales bacterium PC51MH44]
MLCVRKNKITFKVMAIFTLLVFASTAFCAGLSLGRIIPKGKVTLYQGNQKIGEFSAEAPLPEDTLLSVQGECGVKMRDLYLVAIDKSLFSVTTKSTSRKLTVEHGTVYFALSSMPRTLVFQTPEGVITTSEVMLKASADAGLLEGYVSVADGISKVGVLEGGSMFLSVGDGETMRVKTGQELRLAQADLFGEEEEEEEEAAEPTEEMSTTTKIIIGVATVAAIGAAAGGGGGGGGSDYVAPSSPSEE